MLKYDYKTLDFDWSKKALWVQILLNYKIVPDKGFPT